MPTVTTREYIVIVSAPTKLAGLGAAATSHTPAAVHGGPDEPQEPTP